MRNSRMTEEPGGDWILLGLASVPILLARFGRTYVHFLEKRRRGVRAFRRGLRAADVPPAVAARLAQAYHDTGSLRSFFSWRD